LGEDRGRGTGADFGDGRPEVGCRIAVLGWTDTALGGRRTTFGGRLGSVANFGRRERRGAKEGEAGERRSPLFRIAMIKVLHDSRASKASSQRRNQRREGGGWTREHLDWRQTKRGEVGRLAHMSTGTLIFLMRPSSPSSSKASTTPSSRTSVVGIALLPPLPPPGLVRCPCSAQLRLLCTLSLAHLHPS
jgi:hypothetical protein